MEDSKRTIGPVTMATGGAVAITTFSCFLLARVANFEIPPLEQGCLTLILVMVSGWAVPAKRGKRVAE